MAERHLKESFDRALFPTGSVFGYLTRERKVEAFAHTSSANAMAILEHERAIIVKKFPDADIEYTSGTSSSKVTIKFEDGSRKVLDISGLYISGMYRGWKFTVSDIQQENAEAEAEAEAGTDTKQTSTKITVNLAGLLEQPDHRQALEDKQTAFLTAIKEQFSNISKKLGESAAEPAPAPE